MFSRTTYRRILLHNSFLIEMFMENLEIWKERRSTGSLEGRVRR